MEKVSNAVGAEGIVEEEEEDGPAEGEGEVEDRNVVEENTSAEVGWYEGYGSGLGVRSPKRPLRRDMGECE